MGEQAVFRSASDFSYATVRKIMDVLGLPGDHYTEAITLVRSFLMLLHPDKQYNNPSFDRDLYRSMNVVCHSMLHRLKDARRSSRPFRLLR